VAGWRAWWQRAVRLTLKRLPKILLFAQTLRSRSTSFRRFEVTSRYQQAITLHWLVGSILESKFCLRLHILNECSALCR
jgi:hypothetical protein